MFWGYLIKLFNVTIDNPPAYFTDNHYQLTDNVQFAVIINTCKLNIAGNNRRLIISITHNMSTCIVSFNQYAVISYE